ncbi:TetR family transcriptional regulator [Streptodolium elevatio]|uniref:TetR family transcriptional regulator n=1 Tax=Streptodolium elevatio TaxID=3157996 RepID=A0ABV3DMF6_9ACTN
MPTSELPPRALEGMTRAQLARRGRITDAVIELVAESGPDVLQMRDVAARSGISLGTIYRYFSSKEHLLAAAVADWQERLTRQVLTEMGSSRANRPADSGAEERVLRYARRELRAFQRHPHFARLTVAMVASADPYASEMIARMHVSSDEAMAALMHDVPAEHAGTIQVAVQAVVLTGLVAWVTDRKTWTDILSDLERVTRRVFAGI